MNFQRLNEFLEKEKDRFNKDVTCGSIRLAERYESLTGGSINWSTVNGQL
jgi:hypothetical protein